MLTFQCCADSCLGAGEKCVKKGFLPSSWAMAWPKSPAKPDSLCCSGDQATPAASENSQTRPLRPPLPLLPLPRLPCSEGALMPGKKTPGKDGSSAPPRGARRAQALPGLTPSTGASLSGRRSPLTLSRSPPAPAQAQGRRAQALPTHARSRYRSKGRGERCA